MIAGLDRREQRESERGGLAGAGLGLSENMSSGERRGNQRGLDLRGVHESALGDSLQDVVRQAEIGEGLGSVERLFGLVLRLGGDGFGGGIVLTRGGLVRRSRQRWNSLRRRGRRSLMNAGSIRR